MFCSCGMWTVLKKSVVPRPLLFLTCLLNCSPGPSKSKSCLSIRLVEQQIATPVNEGKVHVGQTVHWNGCDSSRGSWWYPEVTTVTEALNIETGQWHTAPDLPQPLTLSSLTLYGDLLYLLGSCNEKSASNSVYSCSLNSLLSPHGSKSLWECLVSTLTRSSKGSAAHGTELLTSLWTAPLPWVFMINC